MFTPPPSPLPPRRNCPPSPLRNPIDLVSSDELEYSPYEDDDDSQPSTPIQSKLSEKAFQTPSSVRVPPAPSLKPVKSARRRVLIPLIAVVLVLVAAASSRYDLDDWWKPPARPSPELAVPVPGGGPKDHAAGHSHDPNRTSRSSSGHQHHHHGTPRIGLSNHWGLAPSATTTTGSESGELDKRADALDALELAAEGTSPSIPDPPYPVPTPFPQPFDTTFSYNFSTSSCQSWFANSLLSNLTFRQCRPLSLLLPASAAFFQAQSNLTALTAVIGGTCQTPRTVADCVDTMTYLASEIQKDTVCGIDLGDENAMALEALNGFRNYQFMREAGCLVNQRTNSYCFVDAVASTSPVDFYFYTLPLGTPLPNKTTPSCSTCVESLLSIYATQAGNQSLDISKTYASAASKAADVCGANYATIPDGVSLSAAVKGREVVW
ncbi:hypothetical protein FRB90_007896, partial [Tulasnella sp. 427]